MSTQTAPQAGAQVQSQTPPPAPAQTPQAALVSAQAEVSRLQARRTRDLPALYRAAVERADGAAMASLRREAADLEEHSAAATVVVARCVVDVAAAGVASAQSQMEEAHRQMTSQQAEALRIRSNPARTPREYVDAGRALELAPGIMRGAGHAVGQAQRRHADACQALRDVIGALSLDDAKGETR